MHCGSTDWFSDKINYSIENKQFHAKNGKNIFVYSQVTHTLV